MSRQPYKRYLDPNSNVGRQLNLKTRRSSVKTETREEWCASNQVWLNYDPQRDDEQPYSPANLNYSSGGELADDDVACEQEKADGDFNESDFCDSSSLNDSGNFYEMNPVDFSDNVSAPGDEFPGEHLENSSEASSLNFSDSVRAFDDELLSENSSSSCDSEVISPFSRLKNFLHSTSSIQLNVAVSVSEIILLVLSLVNKHCLSLTASCDLMKMLNVIMGTSVFPATEYMFKSLFNSNFSMTMHFTCEFCGHYLGKSGDENLETCVNCEFFNSTKGYRYDHTFITLDVRTQLQEIVVGCKDDFMFLTSAAPSDILVDIQSGSLYGKKIRREDEQFPSWMSLTFNADGAQVFKDRTTVTPIYLMINELKCKQRRKNMVLAGLWYGKEKPRFDVFMDSFVNEMNELYRDGIDVPCDGVMKTVRFVTLCCCVDTVARAPLQGITGVNGYYCCSWCTLKGEYVNGTVKYTHCDANPEPRTEEGLSLCYEQVMHSGEKVMGIQAISPLLNLSSFDMVWGFVPDYMHQILLGVVKRCTENFLTHTEREYYVGSTSSLNTIDSRITSMHVPHFLKRQPKCLSNRKHMKAKDFEIWFLFLSVPILNGILLKKYLSHWKLLVRAISILLRDELHTDDVDSAELMLTEYVAKHEEYYGKYEMTYNVHQLTHLADSVRKWGPLWSHTAFPFESEIGNLKRILKATKGIPHQVVTSIDINRACYIITENAEGISNEVAAFCNLSDKMVCVSGRRCRGGEVVVGPSTDYVGFSEGLPEMVQN
ncbi:uncharacterized protein LOC124173112 [Ischnura elegans]|uniref:uncharacterized protein LOC124173112 n=1 Tax=Ischnura elegans TaxID=197161 RepID=UPI001ED8A125|nr:uncharacterized protein LOC124173112 [Ischnura elegans]